MASQINRLIVQRGIDPEELVWTDIALCRGSDFNLFFEDYERSPAVANQVDAMCLSCPVMKQCGQFAVDHGESGVWGGVYYTSGKMDRYKNQHKTGEIWEKIKKRLVNSESI